MDLATGVLLGVVAMLGINQALVRVAGLLDRPWLFLGVQGLNILAGAALLVWGLPGFRQWPAISWFIGLLFLARVVQNNLARQEEVRERRKAADGVERRAALRKALDAGRDAPPPG